ERYWVDGYSVTDNETGLDQWVSGHVEEVVRDKFRRNYDFNLGLNANTTLYGMYNMVNPNWKVKAVRHKIDPRIGFSYKPDFSNRIFGFYEWVQVDSLGNYQLFNMFPSGSASAGKSGSVNFGLSNNIEMKVANSKDTTATEAFKKVAIFDNLSFNGAYNLIAEQFNLSNISINARTKIAGTSININATLDPYALNEKGVRINEYMWNNATGISKLGRIVNVSTGYSFSYSSDKFKKAINGDKTDDKKPNESKNSFYEPFDMPWRVSMSYTFSYTNPNGTPRLMQSVSLNGNIDLTPKWKTTFSSGFDFMSMKITHTKMTIIRDLHCWTMSFDFSPISSRPYYMFTIRANASMLKDLKVERTKY
ncbi:MAG TPA: putative LPS assembly protein LptD, partial [Prolixibacteraceae bacterium]|nr:putative LPS assembly protein LptD [Prolixibacteraceae bacterium]